MKNMKKIMSLFLALVMLVGVALPSVAMANGATTEKVTKTVTLHKLVMSKADLAAWDSDALEKAGYNGTQNTDQLKALLNNTSHSAKEVAGVYFAVKYAADYKDAKGNDTNKSKYVTINETDKENPVYGAVESLDATLDTGYKLLAGKTEANGIVFNTKGLKGNFEIVEVHEKSSYVGENGEAITDMKAVPVKITLPLVNNNGVVEAAHVYPKNTEDKPKIDKNFLKNNELTEAEQEAADKLKVGADYNNYQAKKATAKAEIGKKIPYEVKTEIPAKSNLKEAHWDDKMTEGLTYNNDLEVTIEYVEVENKQEVTKTKTIKATDFTEGLTQTNNGFSLRLMNDNLALLNGKVKPVTVTLKYSATVNSKAIVDIPEANDITFHYGNNKPGKGNTPIPTKPKDNGELTVKKTWADGTPAKGEWAEFTLVNAQTGEDIGTVKFETKDNSGQLETTTTYTPNAKYVKIGNEKEITGPSTKTEQGNVWSFTWTGLDKDIQYKVQEKNNMSQTAHFTKGENGEILIENNKDNNPTPLNPSEPKVVTGGKKFVKTNQDGTKRLAGAEFYVKNAAGKYLVADQKDATKVTTARDLYINLIAAYNDAIEKATGSTVEEKEKSVTVKNPLYKNVTETPKEKENLVGKTEISKKIEDLRLAYEKAFKENANAYKWEDKADNAVVLVSDAEGRFEISGLEYGTYSLEEKTPPAGYAKRSDTPEFVVKKGSYTGQPEGVNHKHIGYDSDTDTIKGQQIENKKVSIPQTGGIGTVIFTVVGISLMAGAFIAMRKRTAEEN